MPDKMDDIVKELAARHGVLLGRDDPVLMLATLQEILVRELQENQTAALANFNSQLEMMMTTWSADSKSKAERIINGALDASKRAIEQNTFAVKDTLEEAFDSKISNLRELLTEVHASQQTGLHAVYCITGGAFAFSLLALFLSVLF